MSVSLIPIGYLLIRGSEIGIAKIASILSRNVFVEPFANSIILTVLVTLSSLIIGSTQAWLVVRSDLRFKSFVTFGAVAPLAIPSYIAAYSWLALFPGLNGLIPAWLVLTICTAPYVFLAMSAALLRFSRSGEEVARTLGYSPFETLRALTWPQVRPAVFGSSLLVALYVLSDFGAVSLLRFDTFTRAIYTAYRAGFDRSTAAVLASVLVLISMILIIFNLRTPASSSIKNAGRNTVILQKLGRWQFFHFGVTLLWLLIAIGVPVWSLTTWLQAGQAETNWSNVYAAIINTVGYAISGGLLVTIVAAGVTLASVRYRGRFAKSLEPIAWLSHSAPGIVFALAFVFAANRFFPAIYQSNWVVLIAFVGLFMPNAISVLKVPISQVPKSQEEVAHSLGFSNREVLFKVVLPSVYPGLLGAFAFVALTIIKELPVTLILRPTGIDTLATKLWSETSINSFSGAAPYAALLIILAGIPALILNQEIRKHQVSNRVES